MKKKYVMPSIVNYDVKVEGVMAATSIANNGNEEEDIQHNVEENNNSGFWAGGKKHNFNAWTTWDDDDQ